MVDEGDTELSDNNNKILRYEFEHQNWWAVSDIVRYLCAILPRNWAAANSHARSEYTHGGLRDAFACFSTGPFVLNRVLNGCFQMVPFRLAVELGIVDGHVNRRSYGLRLWTENRAS